MKPVPFEYTRVDSAAAGLAAMRASEGTARYLAGGQTLGPLMNLRLARPAALVDVSGARDLREVRETAGSIIFGASVTHSEIEDGRYPDPLNGAMRRTASEIAYRVVRNRGTIGGSLAHADPGADWLSFLTATDAKVHVAGTAGTRIVPVTAFVLSAYVTSMADGELITAVEITRFSKTARFGYYKLCRKVGEFADAMGTAVVDPERRYCRVVAGAIGAAPAVLAATAADLARTASVPARSAIESELAAHEPNRDAVKIRMAAVAVTRAIEQALGE